MQPNRPVTDLLSEGRAALARGDWEQARDTFRAVLDETESAEALEGLGWACWWLDDASACIETRERAYRLFRDQDDLRGAARMALWLSDDYSEFGRDTAVANGWFRRAVRLLDDLEPGPEHAWLVLFRAHHALGAYDTATARRLAQDARAMGRTHGLVDIELLALATEGVALIDEGAVEQGMSHLDEAAVAALAGECEELTGVAYTCCLVVSTCDRMRDVDRAVQWCRRMEVFSDRMGIRFVHGTCLAHHASILIWKGDWRTAERKLLTAVDELEGRRPFWHYEAVVRLAELRRRQGRLDEAEQLFHRAESHPLVPLGLAEARLDRGDADTARVLVERALRSLPRDQVTRRAVPLELLVRAAAAGQDLAAAQHHLDELHMIATAVPIAPLRAMLSFASGVVAAASGDHENARASFGDAVEIFSASGAPYEMGRARLGLAESLSALGHIDAARHEASAALRRFDELGAAGESARARALLQRFRGTSASSPADGKPPLTRRQREILALIAEGLTDREIAGKLVVSRHTVHRHVANIYLQLGCSSRAAAVAEATRLGLLPRAE